MMRIRRNIMRAAFLVGCAAVAFGHLDSGPLAEAQPPKNKAPGKGLNYGKYQGASTCSDCHTAKTGDRTTDFVKLDEFQAWRLKDKHSQAYSVLRSPLGKQMEKLLGVKDVAAKEVGCLGCHALDPDKSQLARKGATLFEDGVSCEACHGPAGGWLGDHSQESWRKVKLAVKAEYGLRNLRDPKVQAQVCLSCHQGNAEEGKVITHAMYAVGHPPLPSVELAEFSEMMPRHWYRLKEIPWLQGKDATDEDRENYDWARRESRQVRLALVGGATALQQSAILLQQRSTPLEQFSRFHWPELVGQNWDQGRAVAQNWPELAMPHFDCAACHHELERPSWRQTRRGYRGVPGRPLLPNWPRVLVPVLVREAAPGERDTVKALLATLEGLDQVCSDAPFGRPGPLGSGAGNVATACDKLIASADGTNPNRAVVLRILHGLCDEAQSKTPDYDSARMFTSAFITIYRELPDPRPGSKEVVPALRYLKEMLNLTPDEQFAAKRKTFLEDLVVRKAGGKKDLIDALRAGSVNTEVNHALVTGTDLATLSTINEESAKAVAKRLADYRPEPFLKQVRTIQSALGKE